MTNLCGRYILDVLVQKEKDRQVKLAGWQKALNHDFFDKMGGQGAFKGFYDNSKYYSPDFKNRLLQLASSLTLPFDESDKSVDDEIAQEGYAYILERKTFIKCELIRQLVLRKIVAPPEINESFPTPFDVVSMLQIALQYFSPSHISGSFDYAYKLAETNYAAKDASIKKGSPVPKEGVYHIELFRILYEWIRTKGLSYQVMNEYNVKEKEKKEEKEKIGKDKSLDLLIEGYGKKHAIELVASEKDSKIEAHSKREYGKKLEANDECIIHFTPVELKKEELMYVAGDSNIRVIHVWHDEQGKNYKIYHKENGEVKEISVATKDNI